MQDDAWGLEIRQQFAGPGVFVNVRFCLMASVKSALESLTHQNFPCPKMHRKVLAPQHREDFELALTRRRVSFTHGLQKGREQTGRVY